MIPDEQLVKNFLAGDERSLEVLVSRYIKPIYSFVYRYLGSGPDAENITQDVFVRMWRNLSKFDEQRRFKIWLFAIAKNAAVDFLRAKKTLPFSAFDGAGGENSIEDKFADTLPLPDEIFERKNLAETLSLAMGKLSTEQRMVLFLRYNDHFNFREIGETLGESLNTVKSRHRRALQELKELLESLR